MKQLTWETKTIPTYVGIIFDDWDGFEAQLRAWNCPTQPKLLN